jgi:hypothetical protein
MISEFLRPDDKTKKVMQRVAKQEKQLNPFQGHIDVVYLFFFPSLSAFTQREKRENSRTRTEPHFTISGTTKQLRSPWFCFTFFLRYLLQLFFFSSLFEPLSPHRSRYYDKKGTCEKKIIVW